MCSARQLYITYIPILPFDQAFICLFHIRCKTSREVPLKASVAQHLPLRQHCDVIL